MATTTPCLVVQVPGPQGPASSNGTNGTNGLNAFSLVDGGATAVPAFGATVDLPLVGPPGSEWIAPGQIIYIQSYGYYESVTNPSTTVARLLNLGYTGNVNGVGNFPAGVMVSPAGIKGADGALSGVAGGDLSGNYPNPSLVAVGTAGAYGSATSVPVITTDANGRVANVVDTAITFPTALPPNGAAGGDLTGSYPSPTLVPSGATASTYGSQDAIPVLAVDAKGRVTAASSVKPRVGLIVAISALDLTTPGDQPVAVLPTKFRVTEIVLEGANASLATGTLGFFTQAAGVGTLAADQSLAALTASTKQMAMVLTANNDMLPVTAGFLYARVGTGQAATVNAWVFGQIFS